MDVSAATVLTFEFKYDFYDFLGSDQGSVDVSNDGGANWTTVKSWSLASDRGPKTFTMDATALLGGSTQAQIRFVYDAPGWDWWFEVDDVKLFDPTPPCTPIPGTLVGGFVTDANTGMALNGATVSSSTGPTTQTMGTPLDPNIPDGFWWNFEGMPGLGPSTRTFTATADKYVPQDVEINLVPDTMNQINFGLGAGWLEVNPLQIDSRLYGGETDQQMITMTNHGNADANVSVYALEVGIDYAAFQQREATPLVVPPDKTNLSSTRDLQLDPKEFPDAGPLAPGDVLASWPTGLTLGWGLGFNQLADDVWVGDLAAGGGTDLNHRYLTSGIDTGDTISNNFGGTFAADMAFDPAHGTMWQVNVGGDNCIHEWNPATMTVTGDTICPAFGTSERGLAYDYLTDTFYAGGWNDYAVFQFDRAGNILRQKVIGIGTAGMAFNPSTGHLFVIDNASPNTLWVLDVNADFATVGTIPTPDFADYTGGGLEFDCGGALWAVNQTSQMVYAIDSGESGICPFLGGLPWLNLDPLDGVVPANEGTFSYARSSSRTVRRTTACSRRRSRRLTTHRTAWTRSTCTSPRRSGTSHTATGPTPTFTLWPGSAMTVGCGFGNFCPEDVLLRKHMAVFLERMMHGADYKPPTATGIFVDVPLEDYKHPRRLHRGPVQRRRHRRLHERWRHPLLLPGGRGEHATRWPCSSAVLVAGIR